MTTTATEEVSNMDKGIAGGERVETRWWIAAEPGRDSYALQVVRYHLPFQGDLPDGESWASWTEHLDPDGHWQVLPEGETIPEPTLRISGYMVHALTTVGALVDRHDAAQTMEDLCRRITAQLIEKVGQAQQ